MQRLTLLCEAEKTSIAFLDIYNINYHVTPGNKMNMQINK